MVMTASTYFFSKFTLSATFPAIASDSVAMTASVNSIAKVTLAVNVIFKGASVGFLATLAVNVICKGASVGLSGGVVVVFVKEPSHPDLVRHGAPLDCAQTSVNSISKIESEASGGAFILEF